MAAPGSRAGAADQSRGCAATSARFSSSFFGLGTAERMRRAIPNSRLVMFAGHTHLVQVERPAKVHAAIDAFLQRHGL